jgi:hypothetical protein
VRRALSLALLLCCACARAAAPPLCDGKSWPEATVEDLESGKKLPLVQCWRTPACVRHDYLTRARCELRPRDDDWAPALDVPGSPGALAAAAVGDATMTQLAARFLVNRTLLFTGDSVTEGLWDFIKCEAAREGLRPATLTGTRLPAAADRDEALAARIRAFMEHRDRGPWGGDASKRSGNPPHAAVLLPATGTILAVKYASAYYRPDMATQLELADVLVVNYGLHYAFITDEQKAEYTADMTAFMAQAEAAAALPGRAVLFRETSAQHFPGSGAMTSWQQSHPSNITTCACAPMSAELAASNIAAGYNRAVAAAHRSALATSVRVLPYYNLTAARHDMHEETYCAFLQRHNKHGGCDCTHSCYTPQLGRAVVAGMYAALVGTNADSDAQHADP